MTRMTVETIFAFCVVGAVVCSPAPAPSPDLVTTTAAPAPAPSATAAVTTTGASANTTAAVLYSHTVQFSMTLSNINNITSEAQLVASLASGIASTTGGNVTVVIQHIKIRSTYGGLPSGFSCDLVITAYANMTNLNTAQVTCNGNAYNSGGRRLEAVEFLAQGENSAEAAARRLSTSADMEATIANTGDSDVVQSMKNVIGNTSVSGFQSALNAAGVNASSLSETSPPTPAVSVSSTVTGSAVQSVNSASLQSSVAAAVPGGASVANVTVTTTSEATTTAASSSGSSGSGGSGARPIAAPMMTILAAVMTMWAAVSFA